MTNTETVDLDVSKLSSRELLELALLELRALRLQNLNSAREKEQKEST